MCKLCRNYQDLLAALMDRDDMLAGEVIDADGLVDQFEVEIDDLSIRLLAKAPLANDLRFITTAMKASHDLERVGDEATSIARRAKELNREPEFKPEVGIRRMSKLALGMLNEAIASFVDRDCGKARSMIPRDKEVDSLNKQTYRLLAGYMVENPSTVSRCLHLMMIAKSLERVADHATNVAEEVVYLYEGRDIRHFQEMKLNSNNDGVTA